jgi:hypothetical protein
MNQVLKALLSKLEKENHYFETWFLSKGLRV